MVLLKAHIRPSGLTDGKSKDFDLNVSSESSVREIKEKIESEQNIPIELITLLGWAGTNHKKIEAEERPVHSIIKDFPVNQRHHLIINIKENEEIVSKSSEPWINSGKGNAEIHHQK